MGLLEYRDFGISGEDPDICIDLIEGLYQLPAVRGTDWIVPRLDYQQPGNRRKDRLILPLAGVVRGSGTTAEERREDLLANVTALVAIFDPSLAPGTLRASLGYLGLPAGSEATIEARCRNGAPGKVTGYNTSVWQLWTFELEAFMDWDLGSS